MTQHSKSAAATRSDSAISTAEGLGADVGLHARIVSSDVVQRMRVLLPSQSKEMVMAILGISSNTWLKIKRGEAIRSSVAERLIKRFGVTTTEH